MALGQLRQRHAPKLDRSLVATHAGDHRTVRRHLALHCGTPLGIPCSRAGVGLLEIGFSGGVVGVETRHGGVCQRQVWSSIKQIGGQLRQPASQCSILAIQCHGRRNALDHVGRALEVLGGQGVLNRLAGQPLLLEPHACPPVQLGDGRGGQAARKPLAQHLGEQLMVAIPVSLLIKWDEEQIGSLKLVEACPGYTSQVSGFGVQGLGDRS